MAVSDSNAVRKYGIYLDWGPANYLRTEGIGRQLASFLKGAVGRSDIKFVIACPSWGRRQVEELCDAEQVSCEHIEFISPRGLPLSLRIYEAYSKRKSRGKKKFSQWIWLRRIREVIVLTQVRLERRLVATRNPLTMFTLLVALVPIIAVIALMRVFIRFAKSMGAAVKKGVPHLHLAHVPALLGLSNTSRWRRLYQHLEQSETDHVIRMVNRQNRIHAWYCPTAFWPQFNRINGARLMCVPDIVIADYPAGFERADGPDLAYRFHQMEEAIRGASHCVTYSEHVKYQTLIKNYDLEPSTVHVVPHASHELLQSILVSGTADDRIATDLFCRQLLALAFRAAPNSRYAVPFQNDFVEFIFYASQFRPNKNVVTLLRAFEYLLRRRYKGIKLILTGQPEYHDVKQFVGAQNLQHDVLFLPNLPVQQLAACYRLARLAVNPSLSEGGFPFTFSEALSVGTPVVMSRIPVTTEVVTDPDLQSSMLFDPYDWRDMARRIEWALENRAALLAKQKPLYDQLSQRTWRHVVDDHIRVLDQIAAETGEGNRRGKHHPAITR